MTTRFPSSSVSGAGIGLRSQHYQYILSHDPPVHWFEVLSDNYLNPGGQPLNYLERIRQNYQITLHGVGMSLGSADSLNLDYLARLKQLTFKTKNTLITKNTKWYFWLCINQLAF